MAPWQTGTENRVFLEDLMSSFGSGNVQLDKILDTSKSKGRAERDNTMAGVYLNYMLPGTYEKGGHTWIPGIFEYTKTGGWLSGRPNGGGFIKLGKHAGRVTEGGMDRLNIDFESESIREHTPYLVVDVEYINKANSPTLRMVKEHLSKPGNMLFVVGQGNENCSRMNVYVNTGCISGKHVIEPYKTFVHSNALRGARFSKKMLKEIGL